MTNNWKEHYARRNHRMGRLNVTSRRAVVGHAHKVGCSCGRDAQGGYGGSS